MTAHGMYIAEPSPFALRPNQKNRSLPALLDQASNRTAALLILHCYRRGARRKLRLGDRRIDLADAHRIKIVSRRGSGRRDSASRVYAGQYERSILDSIGPVAPVAFI
jgi:hypothetical protein